MAILHPGQAIERHNHDEDDTCNDDDDDQICVS